MNMKIQSNNKLRSYIFLDDKTIHLKHNKLEKHIAIHIRLNFA